MKLLFVTETLFEGGSELFLLRLARALKQRGKDVTVLLLNKKLQNQQLVHQFPDLEIVIFQHPLQRWLKWLDDVLFKLRSDKSLSAVLYRRWISRKFLREPVIIHTHYIRTDWLVSGLNSKDSLYHVVTVHGDYSAQYDHFKKHGRALWNHMDKKLSALRSRVDRWALLSDEQEAFFQNVMKVGKGKIARINNGYEINQEVPGSETGKLEGKFRVAMAGRGVKEKGWVIAISAMQQMPGDCHLYLLGQSDYLNQLKKKFARDKRIHFLGFHPQPSRIFSQCDLVVMPTLFEFESQPLVIIEALSEGIPVIATETGGIPAMMMDEISGAKAGYLVPLIDGKPDVNQFFCSMRNLYDHPELLRELKARAKNAAKKFDMNECVDQYLKLYQESTAR